jgi:multiple sugar transport system permease protein
VIGGISRLNRREALGLHFFATAAARRTVAWSVFAAASMVLAAVTLFQLMYAFGITARGFSNWRPVAYAYLLWAVAIAATQPAIHGERGMRRLFLVPALLLVFAFTIFPAFFEFYVALTDWHLGSVFGRRFSGLENLAALLHDADYWNALGNMVEYGAAVLLEYAVAFGLALALHAGIRARRFFGIVFVLPFMLSPIAVSWIIGTSIMSVRFGPLARFARFIGWENATFYSTPWLARLSIELMDAWTFVPFMIVLLFAALRVLPREVLESAEIDGATAWQSFWRITFPLMLPVSVTAIALRLIFKLKLADPVIILTSGGPAGATDTASSYIYRVYADRLNIGYGSTLAVSYMLLILAVLTVLLAIGAGLVRRFSIPHSLRSEESPFDRGLAFEYVRSFRGARLGVAQALIWATLIAWAFICLFPIYWTVSTSLKSPLDVMRSNLIPFVDFIPSWRGWRAMGLSPDAIFHASAVREDFLKRFVNSVIVSVGGSALALVVGSLAAYGLARFPYRFGIMRNKEISFFFLSQLVLPPVVLAIPFLLLFKGLALLDSRTGLLLVYAVMVLPIVIWIVRDHMLAIPLELEEAAAIDGVRTWGIFIRIVLPLVRPSLAAAFILSMVLCWNEYFFGALLTSTDAATLPVLIAGQSGTQGINWWSMAALATAAIAPLVIIGIVLQPYIARAMTAGVAR